MDDGPPDGPGTTDPSCASKRDPALQSPGAAPLPLGIPTTSGPSETSLWKCLLCLVPVFKSWLPPLSRHSGGDFSVVLPGWVERRVHILFIWLDPFTSASPFPPLHALYSRFSFAPPCWTETKPTASSS